MKQEWMDEMRDRMQDYRKEAPKGLLDDIKKEMSRRGMTPVPVQKRRAKSVKLWMKSAVAVAALLAVALVLWNGFSKNSQEQLTADNTKTSNQQSGGPSAPSSKSCPSVSSAPLIYNKVKTQYVSGGSPVHSVSVHSESELASGTEQTAADTTAVMAERKQETIRTDEEKSQNVTLPICPQKENAPLQYAETHQKKASDNSHHDTEWSLDAYYSGLAMAYNHSSHGVGAIGYSDCSPQGTIFENQLTLTEENLKKKTTHRQPVKFGFSLNWHLTGPWSLQSGFTYAYLSSDIVCSNDYETYDTDQKLHYVGIPLSLSYALWHTSKFNIYLSAGGEAEKLAKGRSTTVYLSDGKTVSTKKEDVKEHPLQCSFSMSAGLEYLLSPQVSIYAEPGATHYIDNGSDVDNFYKERKINFNLNIGLRLHLNE